MTDTKRLDVTDIDFESIRANLKEYMQSQETLQDYDFEGSAITSIIDLLAYATHYNAVNANVGLNETFLDTAQFRGSVVGHARQLGYTPRSAAAPTAVIDVTVTNASAGELISIPRGHQFRSRIDNTTYTFLTTEEYTSTTGSFSNVEIRQIQFKTAEYVFDSRSSEKYVIPDENVDTSTLRVTVFDSRNSATSQTFNEVRSITNITADSDVYFLSENPDGKYEISFGDGVIGTALENGNLIQIEYGVTQTTAAEGAKIFSLVDDISGFSEVSITTVKPARGGGEKETLDSIRYNAPLSYATQNRAVTPQDFEAVIRENFANLDSVNVWGGEDNDPPVYGKVFISVKPKTSNLLSNTEKDQILDEIIEPKSVVTITPEIVDPGFVYIGLDVFFKYDPSETSLSRTQLERTVSERIEQFNQDNLDSFGSVFRHSSLLKTIDDTSSAVLNSTARVYLKKRFIPTLGTSNQYILNFSNPLYESAQESIIVGSSQFTVQGSTCRFKDRLQPNGDRIVQIVSGEEINEIVVVSNAGFIDGSRIVINNFAPTSFQGGFIEIEALPNSNDIAPTLNNIVTFDLNDVSVVGEVDTIVAGQNFSGVGYNTTPRHG